MVDEPDEGSRDADRSADHQQQHEHHQPPTGEGDEEAFDGDDGDDRHRDQEHQPVAAGGLAGATRFSGHGLNVRPQSRAVIGTRYRFRSVDLHSLAP